MLKEYLVRYNINKRDYFGVAVVVATSMQNAIEILKAQGAYNGTPNSYLILEVALINDTNQYNAACILASFILIGSVYFLTSISSEFSLYYP